MDEQLSAPSNAKPDLGRAALGFLLSLGLLLGLALSLGAGNAPTAPARAELRGGLSLN
jgi:hypothetical protein